ncbi:hypothetical protein TPHA_0I01740 [Tetrapisispora phaffii CBS 4417]|uniref:AB hydrolase-1 domain-containing protein n=1 Tax=Tetrapisispora phaffii (strain ATCC 24235 / CBS 4417 / NBRC 1672 / NRRL Y-8282 / UCD 70-5) TaxID=1071381 RepID=G8BXQ0_TETPH|nr:hypothetical protein TPHA_0I01740 [Tetrapisispora phaffii CBS 4417]CCE64678.1 hypothetical protein TPHA_0I01740 [Tetrapisispora phaffii CBS 4417]
MSAVYSSYPLLYPLRWGHNSTVRQITGSSSVSLVLKDSQTKTNFQTFISQNIPSLADGSQFKLKSILFTGYLQTLYLAVADFSKAFPVFYGREIRTFSDDGIASIDWVMNSRWDGIYGMDVKTGNYNKNKFAEDEANTHAGNWPPLHPRTRFLTNSEFTEIQKDERPLVLVLHGLAGGSHEPIIRSLTFDLSRVSDGKFNVAVLNCRGCSRSKISNRKLFTGLFIDDIKEFIAVEKKKQPNRKIYAVGFSFGATQLANYVGGVDAENTGLESVVFLSNPWDMVESAIKIRDDWWSHNLFSKNLGQFLFKLVKSNFKELEVPNGSKPEHEPSVEHPDYYSFTPENLEKGSRIQSTIEFDNLFTAKSLGLDDAFSYYAIASSYQRVKNFEIPSLVIGSHDDPVTGALSLLESVFTENPNVVVCETDLGGHLAYLDDNNNSWATRQIANYFDKFEELVQ